VLISSSSPAPLIENNSTLKLESYRTITAGMRPATGYAAY
jgi:hypothetical protein